METPKIKSAGEVVEKILFYGNSRDGLSVLKEDRAAIHTSLVAAVEGKEVRTGTVQNWYGKEQPITADEADGYNKALQDTLTIINSIFKE